MRSRISAPRPPSIRLEGLATGYPGDLSRGGSAEALEFTDLDLPTGGLSNATISECDFDGVRATEADLRGIRLIESRIRRIDVPVFRSARSTWRDVLVDGGRLGSAELYESTWTAVRFVGCKLGFVNLRGATLTDVIFEDCVIDELDLGGATVRRAAFPGSSIRLLDVQKATLVEADLRGAELHEIAGVEGLRGATVDSEQLLLLAPLLARILGLKVED